MIGHGLKSGTDQSMLTRKLQLYKARFGLKNAILSLVLEETTPVAPSSSRSSTINLVHQETTMVSRDPNPAYEPETGEEKDIILGPVNI